MNLFERLTKEYTNEEIMQALWVEGNKRKIQVFTKFLEVNYKGLKGGNILWIGDDEAERLNGENEYLIAADIQRRFNRLAPDKFMLHISMREYL